jgi:hypothetical protein
MANEFKAKNGVISPKVILQGSQSGTTTIVPNPVATGIYTLPSNLPTENGLVLSGDTTGNLSWIQAASGGGSTSTYATYVYTGNGSSTTFAVSSGITVDSVLVILNGVTQTPTTNYTVTGSNVIFVAAPPTGMNIQIRVLGGIQGSQGVQGVQGSFGIQGVQGISGGGGGGGSAYTWFLM